MLTVGVHDPIADAGELHSPAAQFTQASIEVEPELPPVDFPPSQNEQAPLLSSLHCPSEQGVHDPIPVDGELHSPAAQFTQASIEVEPVFPPVDFPPSQNEQ